MILPLSFVIMFSELLLCAVSDKEDEKINRGIRKKIIINDFFIVLNLKFFLVNDFRKLLLLHFHASIL
jgi:hypothetical protein